VLGQLAVAGDEIGVEGGSMTRAMRSGGSIEVDLDFDHGGDAIGPDPAARVKRLENQGFPQKVRPRSAPAPYWLI
jgi:hypothetical protein